VKKLGALLTLVLAAGLLGLPSSAQAAGVARLDGVAVHLHRGTTQVVTVNRTKGYHARVVLWRKQRGSWHRVATAKDGRIGYGGLVARTKRKQGSGTTPLGTFGLTSAFGTHAKKKGWRLGYWKIKNGDYWVEDNGSRYYNRYRNKRQGGFRWRLPAGNVNGSERLKDYPRQYEYAIVTSFNSGQVRHRGAGIFLHVNGRGATAGCVSAPRWFLRQVMTRLRPGLHPVIAVGR